MTMANWNSGMDYAFPILKRMMWLFGVWPFQRNELLCTARWLTIVAMELAALIIILAECFQSCEIPKDTLEMILVIEGITHAVISSVFPRMYMKKMSVNISSAVDDWSTLSKEKMPRAIMMGYARTGRIVIVINIVILVQNFIVYIMFLFDGKQQVFIVNNYTVTMWNFPIPVTCLFSEVSYRTYNALIVMHILQITVISLSECISDTFFFCITMHLCGQLELLRNRFVEIKKEINVKNGCKNKLEPLIRRHYLLITLAKNIEDSFNINILMRFLIISAIIAVSGMRLITLIKDHDYNEVAKMFLFIQFYILQCFLFTYAGETLHNQSISVISAIYNSTWYDLPSNIVKDLILIIMRMKTPLQLSAGKFFYLKRTVMTDIMKTTMSYISFLQVTVKE